MSDEEYLGLKLPAPIGIGTGLVALDIVINGWENESPLLSVGGSCGNVMAILAYLGWKSIPVARIGDDLAADFIAKDFTKFGATLDLLFREKTGRTAAVIEVIPVRTSSTRTHFFSFTCPHCGAQLPRHRPILKASVPGIIEHVPKASVFYFDRVSAATLELAKHYSAQGTLVVFEPSSFKNGRVFKQCLDVAHIVKYSHERVGDISDSPRDLTPLLEVDTLGAHGLRFRTRRQNGHPSKWEYLEAYKVDNLKDEAGSGDWCTAGILHLLGQEGISTLQEASRDIILKVLSFGQALAALNCCFEGARGAMYSLSLEQVRKAVADIMAGKTLQTTPQTNMTEAVERLLHTICTNCLNSYKTADLKRVMAQNSNERRRANR
jgi:fructokinase